MKIGKWSARKQSPGRPQKIKNSRDPAAERKIFASAIDYYRGMTIIPFSREPLRPRQKKQADRQPSQKFTGQPKHEGFHAMATLRKDSGARNSAASKTAAIRAAAIVPASDRSEIIAAAWASLGYVSGKESTRDDLTDGAAYDVRLTIQGTIDGQPVAEHIDGRLTIGHASEKASSSTPNISHILGHLLSKLNKATRAKVLAEIPAEYAAGGQSLPELSVGDVADAENLLAALRQTKRITARGAVKCEYELESIEYDMPESSISEAATSDPAEEMNIDGSQPAAAKLSLFGLDE